MHRSLTVGLFALLFASPVAAQDVYRMSEQVTAPKVLVSPKPRYTQAAMLKRISGDVELEVDVLPDGTVATVALVKSLDPELDKSAAEAAKKTQFTPGARDGKPVAVRTTIVFTFSMR
jgi:TonB family protein